MLVKYPSNKANTNMTTNALPTSNNYYVSQKVTFFVSLLYKKTSTSSVGKLIPNEVPNNFDKEWSSTCTVKVLKSI